VVVVAAAALVRAPLARVPENTMKFAVGVMLTSFGIFWGAEGAGASWPGEDLALLAIVPGILLASSAIVWATRAALERAHAAQPPPLVELLAHEPGGKARSEAFTGSLPGRFFMSSTNAAMTFFACTLPILFATPT